MVEGASNFVTFTVTLGAVSAKEVTVKYATADDTAEAGKDYTAKSGSLTFDAGETSQTVEVRVSEDQTSEEDEYFTLDLSEPMNAFLSDGSGEATIVDTTASPD